MSNQEIQLLLGGKKEYSLLGTDGITHPNWGLGSLNDLKIENNVTSDTLFKYIDIGIANGATWGNRYSFCISCTATTISEVYIVLSNAPAQAISAISLGSLLPSNNYYYSSSDNKYYTNFFNGTAPALYIHPNINTVGGQIYFRIEEDGKIYSGYGKNTSSLIATSSMTGTLYVGLVTKQTSGSGSGTFKMISHTINDPDPTTTYQNILQLPNSSSTHTVTATALNRYYFDYRITSWIQNRFGNDRYYVLNMTYNNNNVKIGFFIESHDYSVANTSNFEHTSLIINPFAHYDSTTGQCLIGSTVLATLTPFLPTVFVRIDKNCNFYVGSSFTNNTLIGNIKNYLNFTSRMNYGSSPFGYSIFNSSNIYTIFNLVDSGFNKLPSNDIHGYTYPSSTERNQIIAGAFNTLQQTFVLTPSVYNNFTNVGFPGNDYFIYGERFSFTIKCIAGGMTEWGFVFTTNIGSTTEPTFTSNLSTNYISYQSIDNAYRTNGGVLVSNPSPSPNITTTNGQIYFRIEPDRSIYSGFNQASATLIGQMPSTGSLFAQFRLKGPTSGTYRFIENN